MSGSGRKHVSKWDSKVDVISASHYPDKDPQPVDSNATRRSDQHSIQARTRSRAEQDRSDSTSRSRSRSPVYRARRDHAGSYDRHKTRTRDGFNKRGGDQSSDYGWEDKARKPREARYHHSNDFRDEEATMMIRGARSSDYDDTEERSTRDPRLRRHRSELTGEKETQPRDGDGEGRFLRSSEIPCKFFAAGNCRNGQHCRFSHYGGADRKQPQESSNFYRQDNNYHSGHNRWNDDERLDNGKFSKGTSETKGKGSSSWIDDMEMSPDWNYGAPNLKEEPGVGIIGQSSKSQVDDQRSSGIYSYGDNKNKPMVEKPIADSHHNYNNVLNTTPVEAFNQNHNVSAGGSQQQVIIGPAATDFSVDLNLSNPDHSVVEKAVPGQSGVTREQIDQISNISATIAQFLANGQPIPQLTQALQMPLLSESSMAVQPNHATQSNNNPLGMTTDTDEAPPVTASEENGDTKISNEASKEGECKKAGEDDKDAENVADENEDDGSDEGEDKKERDPKGMKAFKFALVEMVKELLKPAWKEGKMKKDGYKNIVKKVVEKVTGSMQSGNVPQTQEKIDHYLSASKPKLTKLVQAYISKVKKT